MNLNSFWKNSLQSKNQSYLINSVKLSNLNNFSSGENALPLAKEITKTLKLISITDLQSIPDKNCQDIKKKISKVFNVSQNMITVGNGSDEIIENIPRVFIEPGETVLVVVPTFFRFIQSSQRMKAKVMTVFTREEEKFKFTKAVIEKVLQIINKHQPKIIWLCSPNNPTGEILSLDQKEKIVQLSKNLVVIDEAFHEFVDPDNKESAIRLLRKHNNLLVLKTFSKPWGLSGVRFGFGIGPLSIVDALEKWRLPYNINPVTKKFIIPLLDNWHNLKLTAKKTRKNRTWLFNQINRLNNLEIGANSKTNVFILRHKKKNIFQELIKKGILVADLQQQSGFEGKKFVRINIKSPRDNRILIKAFREIN